MEEPGIAAEEFAARREALAEELPEGSLALAFSGQTVPMWDEVDYPFEVDRNFYYLTGVDAPNCVLALLKLGGVAHATLFVPRPSQYELTYFGKPPAIGDYQALTGIQNVMYQENFRTAIELPCFTVLGVRKVLSLDASQVPRPRSASNQYLRHLRDSFPGMELGSAADKVFKLREVKSPAEQALLRKAVGITGEGLRELMHTVRPGMCEYEAHAIFDYVAMRRGCRRNGIVLDISSGPNNNVLHYDGRGRQMGEGDLLLADVACTCGHYSSDVTRTMPVSGRFTSEQRHWYEVVLRVQESILSHLGPGMPVAGANAEARKILAGELRGAGLIGPDQPINVTSARNWAGANPGDHHIGLLVHDVGMIGGVLEPGMVFTSEPGVYLKDLGFGIRLEDDVLVTDEGLELLSGGIPRTPDQIEAAMAEGRA